MSMTIQEILAAQPDQLLPLLEDDEGEVLWSSDELGAICRHQLDVPIRFELGTLPSDQARALQEVADARELLLKNFLSLLSHPHPPVKLLKLTKDFAKKHLSSKSSPTLPREIAAVLYYSSIAVAWVRGRRKISKLALVDLRKGIQWALAQTWLDPQIRQILEECRQNLSPKSVASGDLP